MVRPSGDPDQPPQPGLAHADLTSQGTLQGNSGPSPQLRRQGVPHHLRVSVIAGRAERLAQPRVVPIMAASAASRQAMRAAGTLPVGVARQHRPPLGLAGVDLAERRGGEGDEQPRMGGHRLGDTLATIEPGGK